MRSLNFTGAICSRTTPVTSTRDLRRALLLLRVQFGKRWRTQSHRRRSSVQVLYKFANFDPFARSSYFGRSLDLGQFERRAPRQAWRAGGRS